MSNFWKKLKKPFFVLAPMDDVTDTVFRQIVLKAGKPDVFFTEFANADGYYSAGQEAVAKKLKFDPKEKPLIAQIWGLKPENYFKMAKQIEKMGFSGLDINMGCPEKKVIKNGACSALVNNKSLAKELIAAAKEGAPNLPISVKCRLGFNKIQTEEWIGFLLEQNLDALTVHARTTKELSKVPAHWDEFGKITALRDKINPQTLIIGNGDIKTRAVGDDLIKKYNLDGAMIGTGIFQNLFVFNKIQIKHSPVEMLNYLLEHIRLYEKVWGKRKNFVALKKMFKVYVAGFDGASDLRSRLMLTKDYKDVEKIVEQEL